MRIKCKIFSKAYKPLHDLNFVYSHLILHHSPLSTFQSHGNIFLQTMLFPFQKLHEYSFSWNLVLFICLANSYSSFRSQLQCNILSETFSKPSDLVKPILTLPLTYQTFIHLFIQQIFIEHLNYTSCCARCREYN